MCISFLTNTLSMSDEVIKVVIIEKQKRVTQLFPHVVLTKDAGLGELQLA